MSMSVLIVGQGGREHALAWKLAQSTKVKTIYVAPGNGGTENISIVKNIEIKPTDYEELLTFAKSHHIDLVVAGPDHVVVDGIENYFRDSGIPCFAPTKEAAIIEGSKTFAKDFMRRHNIPTAEYRSFTDYKDACGYVLSLNHRIVIKASGLAAGKGVILPKSTEEAITTLKKIMIDKVFGNAGSTVIIEDFLEGDEISIHTFCDGSTIQTLHPGQDHKRARNGNQGPNTGGMGVYTPTDFLPKGTMDIIESMIIKPTLDGLEAEGRTFRGLLFTGVMITNYGPKVIEYNARFGDPETQSMIPLLSDDTDLYDVLLACTNGSLQDIKIQTKPSYACNVVITAGGYPGNYRCGDLVQFETLPEDVLLFHAGTKKSEEGVRTAGGRVFTVVAVKSTLKDAVETAYRGARSVAFKDAFYRTDIAARGLQDKSGKPHTEITVKGQ